MIVFDPSAVPRGSTKTNVLCSEPISPCHDPAGEQKLDRNVWDDHWWVVHMASGDTAPPPPTGQRVNDGYQ